MVAIAATRTTSPDLRSGMFCPLLRQRTLIAISQKGLFFAARTAELDAGVWPDSQLDKKPCLPNAFSAD
jgi:hypothetical protein